MLAASLLTVASRCIQCRVDLLHTLAETAIGPVGRSVMLQPHQTSRRAIITSGSQQIFEPLVPPHAMAALVQRYQSVSKYLRIHVFWPHSYSISCAKK